MFMCVRRYLVGWNKKIQSECFLWQTGMQSLSLPLTELYVYVRQDEAKQRQEFRKQFPQVLVEFPLLAFGRNLSADF